MKINIFYLITDLNIGGAEKMLLLIAKNLNKEKYNITVGCLYGGNFIDEFVKENVRVINFNMRNIFDIRVIPKLVKFLKKEKIKVIHTHLIRADIYGFIAAKFANTPIIISTKHSTDEFRKKISIITIIDRFIANKSSLIIVISKAVKEFFIKYEKIKPDKIKIIYNGINTEKFSIITKKTLKIKEDADVVGTIARLDIAKGHRYLLKAAQEVLKYRPQTYFLIVGNGPMENELKKLSCQLKIEKQVIFTGAITEPLKFLNLMDIFVLPSLYEGLGIAILEAMMMKKPIIATKVGGITEIIENKIDGILVQPYDFSVLATNIINLLANKEMAKNLGDKAYEKVKKNFRLDKMLQELDKNYILLTNTIQSFTNY